MQKTISGEGKTALVCGAGGFIGAHLVRDLVARGYWVRGVDLKRPPYAATAAHEFHIADLRTDSGGAAMLHAPGGAPVDEVYQLAADMGGIGYLQTAECEIMRNNCLINMQVLHAAAAAGVPRYLLASSACVYRDMGADEAELAEDDAYPASPHNEYGWEKLYAERAAAVYGRRYDMSVRIARLQNCYGPEGAWKGGREKAPAAICRKVAEASDGGVIDVWGNGAAMRAYTYIDDLIDGIATLMASAVDGAVNIGRREYVSVAELVRVAADVAGKTIRVRYIDGPVGVRARGFTAERMLALGWESRTPLREGLRRTYAWIDEQMGAGANDRSEASASTLPPIKLQSIRAPAAPLG